MTAGTLIRKSLLLGLLLVLAPAPERVAERPRHAPGDEGSRVDVGLRFDPHHPCTSWTLYVDLYLESEGAVGAGPDLTLEIAPADLVRLAGGVGHLLVRKLSGVVAP